MGGRGGQRAARSREHGSDRGSQGQRHTLIMGEYRPRRKSYCPGWPPTPLSYSPRAFMSAVV